MRIMVTGSGGQLGSEFRSTAEAYPQWEFFFFNHQELDINETDKVETAMRRCDCDVVINCAAFTSVDRAEADPAPSYKVNRDGAEVIARCAKGQGALLFHFSTNNVFDGNSPIPYKETDPVTPHGINSAAKIAGEKLVRQIDPSHFIIRLGWLYSPFGVNFVKTMLRLGRERDSLTVVSDRVGSPTCSRDVTEAVMSMIAKADLERHYGATYHYANEGICSWYDFAVAIMAYAGLPCRVSPIESSAFPTSGPRGWYTALNNNAIKKEWGIEIPHWQASLARAVSRMCSA